MKKKKGKVFVTNSTRSRLFEDVERAVYHPFSHTLEIYTHSPFGVFCQQIIACEYNAKIKSTDIKIKVVE